MTNHYTNKISVTRSSFRRWLTTMSLMLSMFLLNQSVSYAQALCGTYTVGSGGTYGSVSAAFTALNTNGISCSVVLELLPTYTSALEPGFPINTGVTAGVGAGATITVRPQLGSGVLTISSASVTGTIVESSSQYVIFDGRPGGVGTSRNLVIANTATGSTGTVILQNDASRNTFQYCAIQGVATAVTSGVINIGGTSLTTGNDFNVIDNCDIGDGATTPTNGIVALGTAAKENDNNTISNSNIFNYYSSTLLSKGISIGLSNGAWTISGNRFYQTATRTYPAGVHAAISVVATAATAINFTISNNIIGFSSSAGTGTYTLNSPGVAVRFSGITLSGVAAGPNTISGNQISNITLNTSDASNTTSPNTGTFNGILSSGGTTNITGNTIGSTTGVDNIVINTSGTGSVSAGIIATAGNPAATTISANNIGAISAVGTTNAIGANIRGIITFGNGVRTISLNTIGSTTTANSLRAATVAGGSANCTVIGIETAGTNLNNNLNNTVANLFANGTGSTGQVVGIQSSAGSNTITGNTVRNIVNAGPNAAGSGGTGAVIGISYIAAASSVPQNISQNTIYSLSSTAATAAVTVTGINFQGTASGSSGHIIGRNLVHSLTAATSGTALIIGMNNNATGSAIFQNNMIRLGTDISAPYTIVGLNKSSAAFGSSYLHNSIYIGGSVSAGTALTSAFRRPVLQSAGTDDLKNNIFWNARFNTGGTGAHYALNFTGATLFTSDKNVLLVDTVQGGQTGAINGANSLNLASWRTASGQDASSFADNPKYINPTGVLTAVDLHIQASPIPTVIEAAGTPGATVTEDFDGQTRASFTPVDIGADAGDFTSLGDFVGPTFGAITAAPPSSCTAVPHTITANITDASGVASATFNYSINNVNQAPIAMTNVGGNNWEVTIPANGNALILYTITAIDAAASANATTSGFNSYQDDYLSGGLSAGPDVTICLQDSTTLTVSRTIGKVLFTEITGAHTGLGVGTVASGIGGDDYIELTNLGAIPVDISGWKLEITGASGGAINIPAGNVISAGGTFTISRGAGGTANIPGVYLDGAALSGVGQTSAQGFILSNTFGQIVDVAAINGFNVVGTGTPVVLATDWSGLAINQGAAAAIRRTVGTDNNAASDWTAASAVNLTNFGAINSGLTVAVSPSITWTPGGSNLSSIRVSPAGTTTYTATVSDGVCNASDQVIVNVLPLPANLTVNNGLHCGNKVPVASINAAAGAVLYNWYSAPSGGTLLQSSPSLTYLTPINTTTTFYVSQFDGSCNSSRVAITETVTIPPVVAAQANDSSVCANTVITLTALSANPSYVYTWSAVNGNLQATTGTTVTAQPLNAGTINYIVSALDPSNGCDYIDTVVVTVSANPPLTLSVSNNNICQYGITNLTANIISGTPYCVPTFAQAGNTGDFIENFSFNTITNNASGDGDFTFFNALSTTVIPGNTYPISMQAGAAFSQGFRVWIDYNRNGSYSDPGEDVFNSVTTGTGVFSGTVTIPANAVSGPTRLRVMCKFVAVPAPSEVCANTGFGEAEDYVVNINTAVSSTYSLLWSPASGLNSTTAASVTYTASAPGSFPKTVVATDVASGCTSSASTTIVVADAPEAPTCSGGTVCGQGNVTLNATPAPGGNAANLFWTPALGGKVLGTGPSLTQFVANSGSAIVREKPATAVTSNIGFVGDLTAAAGFFPTTTQGLWFKVNSGNGVLINTVDIYPNGPIGSTLTIAIQDTNGVTIGTATTLTTVTNISTAPTLNKQTVNIGIFVPYSPNAYRMRPTQNPNLAAHNVGVTGAPWQVAGEIQILGYGNMGPSPAANIFANTLYGFFYNWNVTTGCFGDICTAAYTVTTPPALTITPSGATAYCGTGSVGLTAGGSPSWTSFTWSPATGLSATTGASVTATPTVTTTYTVLATDGILNGCSDTAQITITVNTAPFVTAGTAPADTICNQTSFQFNAQGGSPSFKTLGLTQNPGQSSGAVFNGANLNQRSQTLITAAELNAIGLVGPTVINSVGFFVNNKLSTQPYSNFTVKMASDPDVCWSSTTHSVAAATTCYAGNYTTVAGWNDIIFTTPYVWDGVSSIMLETCFSNATTSFFDLVYTTTTPACNKFRSDNAAACSATTGTLGTERPNMRFTGGQVSFSWSPATNLSATNIKNPIFTPTTTGPQSYTVTVTDPSSGCTASSTLNFVVATKPKVTSAFFQANNNEICVSGTKMMIANVFDGSLQWQQSSNGVNFTDIPGANNDTLVTGTVTLDTYYRLKSFCTDSSFSNIIFLDVKNPSLVSTTPGSRCGQGIVNLSATAAAGYYTQWFADSTSFTPLSNSNNYSPFITVTDTFWVAASVDTISSFNGGPLPSYCAISNLGGSCITNVQFATINNSSPICSTPLFWDVIPEAQATANVVPGQVIPLTVTCDGAAIMSVWIDYNRNGVFAADEWQQITTTAASATISVTIPPTATPGKTGMRIRSRLTGNANGAGDACLAMGSGSSQDYTISIGAPSCSSARVPVIATSTPATPISATPASINLCGGGGSATLTISSGAGSYNGFSWSPATGLNTTTGTTVIASPTVNTNYIVTATNSLNGCATTDTVVVTVTPSPVVNSIVASPNPLCFGDSAQIITTVTPGVPVAPVVLATNGVAVTPLTSGSLDDGTWSNIALPFTFTFYGVPKTSISVSTNGFLTFNGSSTNAACCSGQVLPNSSDPNDLISLAWEDWNYTVAPLGTADFFTTGTAPFRKFVLRFTGVSRHTGSGAPTTGEIILHETTNLVELQVTSVTTAVGDLTTMGIENSTGTVATVITGRNGVDNWTANNEGWLFTPAAGPSYTLSSTAFLPLTPSAPFSYSWTPTAGLNSAVIANPKASPAGNTNYVVTVTEINTGCTATGSILIQKSLLPTPKITPNDTTLCFPDVVYLHVVDTLNYPGGYPVGTTIDWVGIVSGLSPTDSISSANGNVYQVQVNLPNGCNALSPIRTITTRSVTVVPVITPATCGANNGAITANITNGNAPFNYVWTDGVNTIRNITTSSTSDAISGLAPGTYFLSVFDNIGNVGTLSCNSGSIPFVVPAPPAIVVNITKTDISCNGNGDGSATASATGGSGTYTYLWSTGSSQNVIGGLSAGTYTVTVTDQFGCTGMNTVTITEPAIISVLLSQTPATCNGGLDGTASAIVSGGTAPIQIDWYEGINFIIVGTGPSLTGVPAGLYFAVVTDVNGCQQFDQITILEPAAIVVSSFTPTSGGVGTPVTITGSGFVNVTDVKFNGISATFTVINPGQINATVPAGATTGTITVITNNICTGVSSGSFTVISTAALNVKAFIEGYYAGGGTLTAVLLNQGIAAGANECDSVTVQLRDQFSPGTVSFSSTSVLGTNGTVSLTVPGALIGNSYYIAVFHRNALQTWSGLPVTISGTTTYDFTTANNQSFGSNQTQVEPGVWAFYTGDIEPQDEFIDVFDQSTIDNDAASFAFGYFATDVNGDGFVDVFDQAVVDNNAALFLFSAHP